jgi:DNA-directed RNA polymerase specialized sigma24 family protein
VSEGDAFHQFLFREEVKRLSGSFDKFLEEYFLSAMKRDLEMREQEIDFDGAEIEALYRMLVDKLVIRIFENMIENELIRREFRKLTKLQRMVIVLNVLMKIKPEMTADMIGATTNSVYLHKSRALRRLRQELENLEDS